MIGTVIKLCRVWKAVPKGIMFRGFPSAILVNATSWECSKGISSKLAQTSTSTEGWMFLRIWVFLFTTTNRKTTQMSARGFTAGSPHRSAPGETLTGNNPHPPDYSSCQTSFTTGAGCNDVDFTASSYAKSGLSLLHSPKNCSGWDTHCACRATHYQCTSKNP